MKLFPHPYMSSKKGDTLVSIARKFSMSVKEVKDKNGLQQDRIYPNQQLYVK